MKQLDLVFFAALFNFMAGIILGCQHSLHEEVRLKRDIKSQAELTAGLRAYFTACMNFMVPDPDYDLSATVDYTVLESLWHLNTGEVYCSASGGGSTRECWQEKIASYLNPESILLPPARTCIAHYSEDQPLGENRYRHLIDRVKRRTPTTHRRNIFETELPRYVECVTISVPEIAQRPNFERLSFFIRNDTRDPCDSGGIEMRTAPSWPYRFVALTRSDTRLRKQLQFCGNRFFPSASFWTSWSRYGKCERNCRQARTRTCRPGNNSNRVSKDCKGPSRDTRSCSVGLCKNVQSWTRWSGWSACIPPCGEGKQSKSRKCLFSNNTEGGDCEGSRLETKSCRGRGRYSQWTPWDSCTNQCKQERVRICELNGEQFNVIPQERLCTDGRCFGTESTWSGWGQWGACSSGCGKGIQIRSRRCILRSSKRSQQPSCRGASTNRRPCTGRQFSAWSDWAACSGRCKRTRTRFCLETNISDRQTESCLGGSCPRGYTWGVWQPYGSCSVSCGGGRQVRRRPCILRQLNNLRGSIKFCERDGGRSVSNRSCNTRHCTSWSAWSSYGRCQLPRGRFCGSGMQRRTRTCRNPTRSRRCKGRSENTRFCRIRCPVVA